MALIRVGIYSSFFFSFFPFINLYFLFFSQIFGGRMYEDIVMDGACLCHQVYRVESFDSIDLIGACLIIHVSNLKRYSPYPIISMYAN